MYAFGASNSQRITQPITQHQHDLSGGIAQLAMSAGGSWQGWARA